MRGKLSSSIHFCKLNFEIKGRLPHCKERRERVFNLVIVSHLFNKRNGAKMTLQSTKTQLQYCIPLLRGEMCHVFHLNFQRSWKNPDRLANHTCASLCSWLSKAPSTGFKAAFSIEDLQKGGRGTVTSHMQVVQAGECPPSSCAQVLMESSQGRRRGTSNPLALREADNQSPAGEVGDSRFCLWGKNRYQRGESGPVTGL